MGEQRSNRVDETLQSLFESLIPPEYANANDDAIHERIDEIIESAKRFVDVSSDELPPDTNQAQDLIKRKLLRENSSPEKAARFSNLYSRLLSIPVLNQKWSILYLLYKLSDEQLTKKHIRKPLVESDQLDNILLREALKKQDQDAVEPIYGEPHAQDASGSGRNIQSYQELPERIDEGRPRSLLNGTGSEDIPMEKKTLITSHQEIGPSETELLRDLPFNLQGLSSKHFSFINTASVQLPKTLPIPFISLLHTLAEPCLLYKKLSDFIQGTGGGLVSQSLRAAVNTELRSYLGLVATLEGEIRGAMTATERGDNMQGVKKAGVTLKKCIIWTRDATMALRLMSLIVEQAQQKRGGQIISLIHGYSSSHGDPFVSTFAERMLTQVTRPFYDMLRRWIYDGELIDPYHEFFVMEPDPNSRPDLDPRRVSTSVWEDKYKLDENMVPTIISPDFAKKVFLIGKSLNFIRHSCSDSDWVIQYSKMNSKSLDYANTTTLFSSIDSAYGTTMSRLTELMSTKFHLLTHLQAIKKYLLLSQGDFIDLLMESLAPNLDRPANSQYRHTLTSQLEHAIRHSNAQYDDAEVLRRLDARMLEFSSGEIGWECFTLEYKISAPCDVVITQWASTQYLKVFNLLLRIKRVEFSLNTTYRRCMTGARGVLASVDDKLGRDWKRARCTMAEMVHFIDQLQYYILFEVIEASWEQFQKAIYKPDATLDDLIESHARYITSITHKGLLGQQRHPMTGQREDSFLAQLHYILKTMLSYRDVVDGLYSFSVAEFTRRQQFTTKVEQRTAQGKWGITEKDLLPAESSRASTPTPSANKSSKGAALIMSDDLDSPLLPIPDPLLATGSDDRKVLESLRTRLSQLSADFRSRINILLYDLARQPDSDMRFLGVVMNFNEFYKPINVRRHQSRKDREKKEGDKAEQSRDAATSSNVDGSEIPKQQESLVTRK